MQFKEEIVDELFGTDRTTASDVSTQDVKHDLIDLDGVGPKTVTTLQDSEYGTVELIAKASLENLVSVPGIGVKTAEKILRAALQKLDSPET